MKKKIYPITILLAMAAFSLSSCLKDSKYYVNLADSKPLVELPLAAYNTGNFQAVAYDISTTPVTLPVVVNIAAPKPLTTATTVTLALDPDDLAAYNTANNTNYTILPPADYSVSSWTVTIPALDNQEPLNVKINSSLIDPSQQYILPIKISNGGGLQISNYNYILYNVQVKNIYDGVYSVNGFVFRDIGAGVNDPALGGNFSGFSQALSTQSSTSVTWAPLWASGSEAAGVAGTTLTVNPATNAVTVSSTGNTTLANAPGYNSHYDPAKQIFYISYKWGASPNDRAETDTLTYTGSR